MVRAGHGSDIFDLINFGKLFCYKNQGMRGILCDGVNVMVAECTPYLALPVIFEVLINSGCTLLTGHKQIARSG